MSAGRDNLRKRCGCPEARWPKCVHAWWLIMRHNGTRWPVSLDVHLKKYEPTRERPETRGQAETLAGEIAVLIRRGAYPPAPSAPSAPDPRSLHETPAALTVATAATAYVEAVVEPSEVDRATVKQFEARYRRLGAVVVSGVGRMGDCALTALTSSTVEAWYRLTTRGMSNSSKHKYRQALTRLVQWAVARQHLAVNPITTETALVAGPDTMRNRRVHPDEEANLLQAASETQAEAGTRLVALLILAFDLGGRLGELLALKWGDVLWEEGRVCFRAVERGARKNRKPRRVPMTARVRALLQQLRLGPTGQPWPTTAYVLGNGIGERVTQVRKAWVTCALRAHNHGPRWIKAGVNKLAPESREFFARLNLHFHDLRHECALRWLEQGYTLPTIAVLLGHNDLSTLRVYLGLAERDALMEAEAINAAMPLVAPPVQVRRHDGQAVLLDPASAVPGGDQLATKRLQNGRRAALRVVRAKEATGT